MVRPQDFSMSIPGNKQFTVFPKGQIRDSDAHTRFLNMANGYRNRGICATKKGIRVSEASANIVQAPERRLPVRGTLFRLKMHRSKKKDCYRSEEEEEGNG